MAQPLLDLGDVGLVLQGIGGGGGAQAMDAEAVDGDAGLAGIVPDQGVDAVGAEGLAAAPAAQGLEQRGPGLLVVMAGGFQVVVQAFQGDGVERQVAQLVALAVDAQVLDAAALVDVLHAELGGLLAAQAVVEEHGEQGTVALAFYRGGRRRLEQGLGLVVAERRGLALAAVLAGPLHPVHRVAAGDGVAFQQVVEQAGQGGELAADAGPGEAALFELLPPGEHMGAGDGAELFGGGDADELAEVLQVALVGAAGARVVEVGEPLGGGRHLGQVLELGGGEAALGRCRGEGGGAGGGYQLSHAGQAPTRRTGSRVRG